MPIIVGGILEKDGKYLLVQEAKESCRGKWNIPAGHLEPGETLLEGAKREIREESGCEVALTGLCLIGTLRQNDNLVSIIFSTRVVEDQIAYHESEILDVRWFSYEEILAMKQDLRAENIVLGAIGNLRRGVVAPLTLIHIYDFRK